MQWQYSIFDLITVDEAHCMRMRWCGTGKWCVGLVSLLLTDGSVFLIRG